MLRSGVATVLVITAGSLFLAGCVPQSVADGSSSVDLREFETTDFDGTYPAIWEDPNRLSIIIGGSSTCEAVITKVEENDKVVVLTQERKGGPLCSADMVLRPTLFLLENGRPDDVIIKDGSSEFTLEVVDRD